MHEIGTVALQGYDDLLPGLQHMRANTARRCISQSFRQSAYWHAQECRIIHSSSGSVTLHAGAAQLPFEFPCRDRTSALKDLDIGKQGMTFMSIDAIAVLPKIRDLHGKAVEGDWKEGEGPGASRGLWRQLPDGIVLNLGLSIQSPDADLYEAVRLWMGTPPEQVWVFPDTAFPGENSAEAIRAATREVGRWVKAGRGRPSILEGLGFSPEEEKTWQREINSGDPARIQAAVAAIERRTAGRDPAEIEALLGRILRRG